jgi:hypothetical protein
MNHIDQYIDKSHNQETFTDMLFRIIREKDIDEVELYKSANLDRKYFSKLRCNRDMKPKKKVVCALAIALKLDQKTSKTFIKKAGYILTSANKFDLVIRYCLENKIYDLFTVNELLYEQTNDTLLNTKNIIIQNGN